MSASTASSAGRFAWMSLRIASLNGGRLSYADAAKSLRLAGGRHRRGDGRGRRGGGLAAAPARRADRTGARLRARLLHRDPDPAGTGLLTRPTVAVARGPRRRGGGAGHAVARASR